jgi:peroxiredoxin
VRRDSEERGKLEMSDDAVLEARDFALTDTEGNTVRLSDYRGVRHVILVFNRGFM